MGTGGDDMRRSLVENCEDLEASASVFKDVQDSVDASVYKPRGEASQDVQHPVHRLHLALILASTSFLVMLYGYDFGITAWTVLNIKYKGAQHLTSVYVYLEVHTELLGVLVAFTSIGGTCGGIAGRFLDCNMGRKTEIQLVSIVCMVGALMEGLTGTAAWSTAWPVVAYGAGRFLYGFGLGLMLRCAPMYLREVVPKSARDKAMISIKLAMVMGMILSYVVGALIGVKLYGYFGSVVLASISLFCLQFLPESPHYMLLHNARYTKAQALEALRFTTPSATLEDLEREREEVLAEILSYIPREQQPRGSPVVTGFTDDDNGTEKPTIAEARRKLPSLTRAPGMKASLTLTAGVMVFEQASGMTALLYYAAVFLADIDVVSVDWGLGLLGVLQLLVVLLVMYVIDPIGRKPLLAGGVCIMAGSAALLAFGAFLGLSTLGRWEALIGLYTFTAGYTLGLGALPWVLIGEAFPTCHRAQATSIVISAHFGAQAVTIIALQIMEEYLGYGGMFCIFFLISLAANWFTHRFMVETRGLSMLEVQRALTAKAGF